VAGWIDCDLRPPGSSVFLPAKDVNVNGWLQSYSPLSSIAMICVP
jgi:hypothetical protein